MASRPRRKAHAPPEIRRGAALMRGGARALLLLLLFLLPGTTPSRAERPLHTRTFLSGADYLASITISPQGHVIGKSGDGTKVFVLDGYNVRQIGVPEEGPFRVYESRSGQLWTLASDGLALYHGGSWTMHPIADVRHEIMRNPIRQRQIALLPAEVNRVLILLPDRLLEYDASTGIAGVLKEAPATSLGSFIEMSEGLDGSLWVSGLNGAARGTGPVRKFTPQSEWVEFLLPPGGRVNNLQKPFDSGSAVTFAAVPTFPGTDRAIAQLRDGEWRLLPAGQDRIRQAWTGWDGAVWAYTYNALLRWHNGEGLKREIVSTAQYDTAVETNGIFWVTSADGLVRYAPFLWRARDGLEDLQAAVHAMHFEADTGNAWLATSEGLILRSGGADRKVFRWPEEMEPAPGVVRGIFPLEHGELLVEGQGGALIFDKKTGAFRRPPRLPGLEAHFIGQFRDGTPCAWMRSREKTNTLDLRRFNGKEFIRVEVPEVQWEFEELTTFKETSSGEMWAGSNNAGILHFRPGVGLAEVHGQERGLPNDRIYALEELGDGRMWCGTSARLYEYQGQRWTAIYNTLDRVTAISRTGEGTFVGTTGGLYRYYQDSWIYYGVNEGLPSLQVYTVKRDGRDQVWVGTSRGVVSYFPDADPDPPRSLPAVVQEQPSAMEPTTVNFRAQDKWNYTSPGDLLFSYRLDEGSWTPFSNITYRVFQNLSSGTHLLETLAMDKNGNKSPSPSRVEFSVIVPWSRDPRLLVVLGLAAAVTVGLGVFAVKKHIDLIHSYAAVERIVEERTRELEKANNELLHSQKMRAIGTMAAGIAHDFNNILSIIKGSAQIIESNVEDREKIQTRVNRIQTVVAQGSSIVKALLGLGRLNEQEISSCHVPQLLEETKKLVADRFPPAVSIEVDCPSTLPDPRCSREVVQQMLLNFILNAVDSMNNEGTVLLGARLAMAKPANLVVEPELAPSYIEISVTDHGVGVPPEILPRIFEPFFTTKSFSSRRGTGLGLSMVYELVKGMGYGLKVESKVNEGSVFSIYLPLGAEGKTNRA